MCDAARGGGDRMTVSGVVAVTDRAGWGVDEVEASEESLGTIY